MNGRRQAASWRRLAPGRETGKRPSAPGGSREPSRMASAPMSCGQPKSSVSTMLRSCALNRSIRHHPKPRMAAAGRLPAAGPAPAYPSPPAKPNVPVSPARTTGIRANGPVPPGFSGTRWPRLATAAGKGAMPKRYCAHAASLGDAVDDALPQQRDAKAAPAEPLGHRQPGQADDRERPAQRRGEQAPGPVGGQQGRDAEPGPGDVPGRPALVGSVPLRHGQLLPIPGLRALRRGGQVLSGCADVRDGHTEPPGGPAQSGADDAPHP
jgi:hypothetical protein